MWHVWNSKCSVCFYWSLSQLKNTFFRLALLFVFFVHSHYHNKYNGIGLSRMSTIFWLLISISSLHRAFISLGTLLKGSSSLPWLISSQPHRSQAFPTQCSLCSHKDPRNPAACPQLIFPVATLLTQPPTGSGCKCKARNRLLCVCPPIWPIVEWQKCQSLWGVKPLSTISFKGFSASPNLLIKQHDNSHQTPSPTFLHLLSPAYRTVCLLSLVLFLCSSVEVGKWIVYFEKK